MFKSGIVYLLFLMGLSFSAQKVTINGKVTNKNRNAVSGAVVALKSRNLKDTTDATGSYSLLNGVSVVSSSPEQPEINTVFLGNYSVTVSLTRAAPVHLELFDVRGNLLERFDTPSASAMEYRLDLKKNATATNLTLIRVFIGQHSSTFRYLSFKKRS
jgi:hypothetical protein